MTLPELKPGDALLYFNPRSLFNWIIAIKTWTLAGHIEVYRGNGQSVASRDGVGVNFYPLRREGLVHVCRPPSAIFSIDKANSYFLKVQGQKYDWLGLLCFTLAAHQGAPDRMFCSEFATRYYRAGGLKPFADDLDADHVAPAQFLQSPVFEHIWSSRDESAKAA